MNLGLIPGGQNLGKERQTVFFLPVGPMDEEHKDPETVDLGAPRLAWYKHTAWKKHLATCRDTVSVRWLPSGCECASVFLRASRKVGSLISISVVLLGVAGTFQTHIDGFSLIVHSGFVERICDGVIVSEA